MFVCVFVTCWWLLVNPTCCWLIASCVVGVVAKMWPLFKSNFPPQASVWFVNSPEWKQSQSESKSPRMNESRNPVQNSEIRDRNMFIWEGWSLCCWTVFLAWLSTVHAARLPLNSHKPRATEPYQNRPLWLRYVTCLPVQCMGLDQGAEARWSLLQQGWCLSQAASIDKSHAKGKSLTKPAKLTNITSKILHLSQRHMFDKMHSMTFSGTCTTQQKCLCKVCLVATWLTPDWKSPICGVRVIKPSSGLSQGLSRAGRRVAGLPRQLSSFHLDHCTHDGWPLQQPGNHRLSAWASLHVQQSAGGHLLPVG